MDKRIIIKLSGEGLSNKEEGKSVDFGMISKIAKQVKEITKEGYQVGVIVGGGNFWRGAEINSDDVQRVRADYIGMLATIMNALVLQSGFEKQGIKTKVQSAVAVDPKIAEIYTVDRALSYLENGEVVIFAGGTGRPYFTTDTTSTLIASEIEADVILMGKNGIDGIYTDDPNEVASATHIEKITYSELLEKGLMVMDSTAAALARDNGIKLIIFNINEEECLIKAIQGKIKHSTVVK